MTPARPYAYRRWHLGLLVLLAGSLHLPTLRMGFFADDYGHQIALRGLSPESPMRPWNLYDFGVAPKPGEPLHDLGAYPWWTPADWKARFFRPLTSLSLALDHALFGGWATGYHLTSLVIYGILILLVFNLFHATGLSPGACMVALLIFVCGDSALLPVGWPANRNTLLECTFLVACIVVTVRAARSGRSWLLVAAVALGLGAMLCKESGIEAMILVPIFTYWFLDRSRAAPASRTTILTALVCVGIAASYLVLYIAAGFGTKTAFYPMPWNEPLAFTARLLILAAIAPLSFIGFAPVDVLTLAPKLAMTSGLICAAPSVILCVAAWRRVRQHPTALLWVLWIGITLGPQGTPPASDRLLFIPAVGSAALLGILLTTLSPAKRWGRLWGGVIALGTLVVSPLGLLVGGTSLAYLAGEGRASLMELDLGPPSDRPRDLIFLQSPNDLVTAMALSTLAVERGETNFRAWPMQLAGRGLRWTRIDERTFDFESLDRPFFTNLIEIVFLNTTDAPAVGTTWTAAIFTVEATEARDGHLRRFRVRFNESPDNPSYLLLAVDAKLRFQRVLPPAIGASVDLPRVPPAIPWLDLANE